jgi:hypothetical protein
MSVTLIVGVAILIHLHFNKTLIAFVVLWTVWQTVLTIRNPSFSWRARVLWIFVDLSSVPLCFVLLLQAGPFTWTPELIGAVVLAGIGFTVGWLSRFERTAQSGCPQ